ncbi:transmembrane protein 106A [Hyla sarda]|uniref:transmembrane protein 106A n=1 Tax=Hyla sarda TaxID=327740 RepID=UPI0024C2B1B8|nr:transmembrane protein 106A [Hyla sarda]XP_056403484.1 transmembrane protein 106A [Hyla sarda]XP_056403485.1 transmembrane protein 106A [Hyla sarda]XP_056403486.1 transmembrane protein 106A [Hyla sarda]XP_056403487.1 transmembrane protein 106A [Hyla sarda]XP_056403488.1 transmembrane protein 106A [Hyla sarda]XP_056403489.1 transmembrane protein 106A [Hyla sarda]
MQKALSAFKRLVGLENQETEPILERRGHDSPPPYISINSHEASTSCNSIEEITTVTCSTCRGTGRIPRGQEKELVALIPYSDQRLKPRRTKLYVALAVSCCFLVFFLVVFFLYPRSVTLEHAGVNSSLVTYDTSKSIVNLHTTNKLNISNNNLFGIEILSLNVEVLHMSVVVGTLTLREVKSIGPLITNQIFYTVESEVQDLNTYEVCTWDRIHVHNILLHVQGSLNCSYLGHVEQIPFEGYEYLDCHSNSSVPH